MFIIYIYSYYICMFSTEKLNIGYIPSYNKTVFYQKIQLKRQLCSHMWFTI